ncbi:hypothetical protein [Botryobacter ruber]|uniref:hypothetical protein n=1 Tax=Botryobacter ruber TaxID=2171629 RepID=UPI000F64DD63|nr:hypothetical protein [Botryobacter ruber]
MSEQLHDGLKHVAAVIREKNALYLLVDAKRLNAMKASDQTWIKNNFFPELSASGLKKLTRVTNTDIFTQVIVGDFVKLVQENEKISFDLQSFYDRDDALEWLLNDISLSANTL